MKGKKTILTDEQREWLIANFADTKSDELAARLGINVRTVRRHAKRLGLTKSAEFMRKIQLHASQRAHAVVRAVGVSERCIENLRKYGAAHRFKKGETPADRIGEERWREARAKGGKTLTETYRNERRRLMFGLPQKTNLRVTNASREKIQLRSKLRRKGYVIERTSNDAYITEDTRRSALMERRAEAMGIHFYEYE